MRFESLYRISLYAMLFLAALMVNLDAEYSYARLYPVAVAAAGAAAFLLVDRPRGRGLNRGAANALALAAFVLAMVEFGIEESLLVLACGHLLIYLTVIKMFMPKTEEDDWFLCLLGVVQVMVAGFLSQSDLVGMTLLAWSLAMLWVLSLFHLRREAVRAGPAAGTGAGTRAGEAAGPPLETEEPYPGLVDASFLAAGLRVALATMALGGVIFLIMPRSTAPPRQVRFVSSGRHLTGFSDDMRLGQLGEILENNAIVMSVELINEEGRAVAPPGDRELLWRGVAMGLYKDGRWYRQDSIPIRNFVRVSPPPGTRLRQQIKMEPGDHDVLFGLRPIFDFRGGRRVMRLNKIDGSLFRADRRDVEGYEGPSIVYPGAMEYEVTSSLVDVPQPGEVYPNRSRLEKMLAVPPAMTGRLRGVADPVVAAIDPEDVVRRARALETFLRDSGQFHYTLRMGVADARLDPIEDFVFNRKQGHCEYFASALTMLLRAEGIPARMVNGFKGGDWNELVRIVSVRQKHAHSWVEALIGRTVAGEPIWLTLDPTPPAERDESLAQVGGAWGSLRWLRDTVRYIWVFYVVGFNADRQERVLYRPIRELAEILYGDAQNGFHLVRRALWDLAGWLLDFPDVSSFFSVKGFVVSCFGMLGLAASFLMARGLWRRVAIGSRRAGPEVAARGVGVAVYRRLLQVLAGVGLARASSETPRQFARRAAAFLPAHGLTDAALGQVPEQVVEAFYRIRFGHLDLPPDALTRLEARLDAFEEWLMAKGKR